MLCLRYTCTIKHVRCLTRRWILYSCTLLCYIVCTNDDRRMHVSIAHVPQTLTHAFGAAVASQAEMETHFCLVFFSFWAESKNANERTAESYHKFVIYDKSMLCVWIVNAYFPCQVI